MILDLLAGFIIICVLIVYFTLVSLSATYWYVVLPFFVILIVLAIRHENRRVKTPLTAREVDNLANLSRLNDMLSGKSRKN